MSGEIRIQIEDDDEVTAPNAKESIADIERRAAEADAVTARLKHETARHRADIARMRVGTALTKAGMEANEAAAEYRSALEAGDIDTQTAAQARMAEVEARRIRLREHEAALERSPVLQHADPVEALAATRTEPTAKWLREHRDWVTDPKKNAKLTSAHFDAVAEGLTPDTESYFEHVERRIGLSENAKGARSEGNRSGGRPPAKYDRRDPRTHVQGCGRDVFLTKGERERATDGTLTWNFGPKRGQPIGTQEFARRKAAMHAEGRYNQLNDLEK